MDNFLVGRRYRQTDMMIVGIRTACESIREKRINEKFTFLCGRQTTTCFPITFRCEQTEGNSVNAEQTKNNIIKFSLIYAIHYNDFSGSVHMYKKAYTQDTFQDHDS